MKNNFTINSKILLLAIAFVFVSVELSGQLVSRVYKDDCYRNSSQSLYYPYSYRKSNLSFGNDRISSVDILNHRYYVRLYEDDNYRGEYRDIYADMNDLSTIDFEDETSSIRVRRSYTTLPTANEVTISANILNGSGIEKIHDREYYLPKSAVGYKTRIHMQSLALNKTRNKVVMTGCVASSPISGCTGESYILLFNSNGGYVDKYIPQRYFGQRYGKSHPVHSQLIGNNFAVAVTEMNQKTGGPTKIMFHTIANDNIAVSSGQGSIYVNDDIGAIAYSNINGNTYLVGGTFQSKRLYIWKANGENRISGFQLIANNINPQSYMTPSASLDENWSNYNSFWLGKFEEDGRVVLFATHSSKINSFADVFEVQNLHYPSALRLIKIHKKTKGRWTTNRQYFLEGTLPIDALSGNTTEIHAFPDDFKVHSSYYLSSTYFTLEYEQKTCVSPTPFYRSGSDEKTVANDFEETDLEDGGFQLKVSPNPVSNVEGTIKVHFEGLPNEAEYVQMLLFDTKGTLLKEVKVGNDSFLDANYIDISNLAKGIYFVRAFTKNGLVAMDQFVKI